MLEISQSIEAFETMLLRGVSDEELSALVSATSKIMTNYAQLAKGERDATRPPGTEASSE